MRIYDIILMERKGDELLIEIEAVMFLRKEQIKSQIKDIIMDDVDNDIVFIVANRGIGKKAFLKEIYGNKFYDPSFIIVDGSKVFNECNALKRCFVEGILEFISRNNKYHMRLKLCKEIKKYVSLLEKLEIVFTNYNRYKDQIINILCDLSIFKLKQIYTNLAGNLPLILLSFSVNLTWEEKSYLCSIRNDNMKDSGARITHIIALRATDNNISCMNELINNIQERVYVLPLLPKIIELSDKSDPKSIAGIKLSNQENIKTREDLSSKLSKTKEYFEMCQAVSRLFEKAKQPYNIFILAKEEISYETFEQIKEITHSIYRNQDVRYEKKILLPYNDKLMWLDSLTYYLALQLGIEEAIIETQKFFLYLIYLIGEYPDSFCYEKTERKTFMSFISTASNNKGNVFVEGFSKYYSDFALLVKTIYLNNKSYRYMLSAVQVLDRLLIEFSDDNINALMQLYENTQICSVIDTGFNVLESFISDNAINTQIKRKENQDINIRTIESFQINAFKVACKWNDISIIKEMASLLCMLKKCGYNTHFSLNEVIFEENGESMFFELAQELEHKSYKIGDFIMPKKTIFLSYAHADEKIANIFEEKLKHYNYEVKRDINEMEPWHSLQDFMKRIRKEDYVVCLVSNTYLRRENCMYEITQLLKDEDYADRTFTIIIEFSQEELFERKKQSQCLSMFDSLYRVEITDYWQKKSDEFEKAINGVRPENIGELAMKFREIDNYAQNISQFMERFFKDILETVKPESIDLEKTIEDISESINNEINMDNRL